MNSSRLLRKEAYKIIEEIGFVALLEPFGQARVVGSVALDLVVKPDIDIHLVLKEIDPINAMKSIAGLLIADERINEIRISDYLTIDSLKIGIDKLAGVSTDWSIDIWITSDNSTAGFEDIDHIKDRLSPDVRELILEIKRFYYQEGLLQDGMSTMIYKAVIDDQVASLNEFQKYLKDKILNRSGT